MNAIRRQRDEHRSLSTLSSVPQVQRHDGQGRRPLSVIMVSCPRYNTPTGHDHGIRADQTELTRRCLGRRLREPVPKRSRARPPAGPGSSNAPHRPAASPYARQRPGLAGRLLRLSRIACSMQLHNRTMLREGPRIHRATTRAQGTGNRTVIPAPTAGLLTPAPRRQLRSKCQFPRFVLPAPVGPRKPTISLLSPGAAAPLRLS